MLIGQTSSSCASRRMLRASSPSRVAIAAAAASTISRDNRCLCRFATVRCIVRCTEVGRGGRHGGDGRGGEEAGVVRARGSGVVRGELGGGGGAGAGLLARGPGRERAGCAHGRAPADRERGT